MTHQGALLRVPCAPVVQIFYITCWKKEFSSFPHRLESGVYTNFQETDFSHLASGIVELPFREKTGEIQEQQPSRSLTIHSRVDRNAGKSDVPRLSRMPGLWWHRSQIVLCAETRIDNIPRVILFSCGWIIIGLNSTWKTTYKVIWPRIWKVGTSSA